MQDLLGKVRNLDAIITDPPYEKEYLPLYGELARLSVKALKPNGVLAVMCGQSYLPEILAAMTPHMKYRWQMAYLTPGPSTAVWQNGNVNTNFKPILIFGGGKRIVDDVVRSDSGDGDKLYHEWGQSESGFLRLIERLTEPNDLICDPFLGGGTTAIAAVRLSRRIVGCDIDGDMVETARRRVALELEKQKVVVQ
jgi:23S rRNA G2445 N2-methylase RlmL